MAKKGLCAGLVLVMLLLIPGISHALTFDQKALVGLKGVHVMASVDSPNLKEIKLLGLTKGQIQKDTELRLRKAGVKVLTKREWLFNKGLPSLMVNLSAFIYQATCAYMIRVELMESVTLARGRPVR